MEAVLGCPVMPGAEYLNLEVLGSLWEVLGEAFAEAHRASGLPAGNFFKTLHPAWNVVGRVHFNLAENRKDPDAPFAFLATYTGALSAQGKAQHLPLGQALREYAGDAQRDRLLSLLLPVQRAAGRCPWLSRMVEEGEIFQPMRWSPQEAFRFLQDVPQLEQAGVVVRMPSAWHRGRPSRPRVSASVGKAAPSKLELEALLDFRMAVTLEGEPLDEAEIEAILATTNGLALVRGQWVEVDSARLAQAMERFRQAQKLARREGLSFAEGLRLLAGAELEETAKGGIADPVWTRVEAGPWLKEVLAGLRGPEGLAQVDPGDDLKGTLRPYQQVGLRWLHLLSALGLGACLTDDMGLGKTLQVITLLLVQRREGRGASLLVAPASLLANWAGELERFAPNLRFRIVHPTFMKAEALRAITPEVCGDLDLVITSYGTLLRLEWLAETPWNLVVADEAQALKNPGTRQTRAAKQLRAKARIALTGTPVENHLGDLWSIFDFIQPGLLGNARAFGRYIKELAAREHNPYGPLRELVRPYILRRLKTDRNVIQDLPDKTELKAYCPLSRKQAALYQEAVEDLARQLGGLGGGHPAQGPRAVLPVALQADLQPPLPGDGAPAPSPEGTSTQRPAATAKPAKKKRTSALPETVSAKAPKAEGPRATASKGARGKSPAEKAPEAKTRSAASPAVNPRKKSVVPAAKPARTTSTEKTSARPKADKAPTPAKPRKSKSKPDKGTIR